MFSPSIKKLKTFQYSVIKSMATYFSDETMKCIKKCLDFKNHKSCYLIMSYEHNNGIIYKALV